MLTAEWNRSLKRITRSDPDRANFHRAALSKQFQTNIVKAPRLVTMPSVPGLINADANAEPKGPWVIFLLVVFCVVFVAVSLESLVALGVKGYFFFGLADKPLRVSFLTCKDGFVLFLFSHSFILAFVMYCFYYGVLLIGSIYAFCAFLAEPSGDDLDLIGTCIGVFQTFFIPLLLPVNFVTASLMCFVLLLGVIFNGGDNVPRLLPFYSEFYEFDYTNCINSSTLEGIQVLEMHKLATFLFKFEVAGVYFIALSCCFVVLLLVLYGLVSPDRRHMASLGMSA